MSQLLPRLHDDLALDIIGGSDHSILHRLDALHPLEYPLVDCHVHAVNFLQETKGLASLLASMDRANISKAVVFGLPVTKMWQSGEREAPEYYLDDDAPCYYYSYTDAIIAEEYLRLPPEGQARIFPLMCGFDPMDRYSMRHIERMYQQYPWVFCGIGETFFRHDDLSLLTHGETPRMDRRVLEPILEFISEYDLPFLIHNNISSTGTDDHPRYLHEVEDALRAFPRARVVLCHCGASRRVSVPYYHAMLERLLTEYESLSVDFSWVMFDEIICRDGAIEDAWYELSEKFSDRILLGSDVIGNFHKIGVINSRFMPFLRQLSDTARANICTGNAERLFWSSRSRVEKKEGRVYPPLPRKSL